MNTICLFASDYASSADVHQALKQLLGLPEYYGMNADALNDCLGSFLSCPSLWVRMDGSSEVCSTLNLITRVFQDNEGIVKEL